jgi:hypothetical protein
MKAHQLNPPPCGILAIDRTPNKAQMFPATLD